MKRQTAAALATAGLGAALAGAPPLITALTLAFTALVALTFLAFEVAAAADGVERSAWAAVAGGEGGAAEAAPSSPSWLTTTATGPGYAGANNAIPSSLVAVPRFVHPSAWPASSEEEEEESQEEGEDAAPGGGRRPLTSTTPLVAARWAGRPAKRGARRPGTGLPLASPPYPPPGALPVGGLPAMGEEAVGAWLGRALPCEACTADIAAALATWQCGMGEMA